QDVERWRLDRAAGQFRGERLLPPLETGKNRPALQVALSPDGSTAYAVCDQDGTGRIFRWDVRSGRGLPGHAVPESSLSRLALSPDGKTLAAIVQTGGRSGVWVWPADDAADAGHGLFNDERPRCLTFSGEGKLLVVGCRSGRVCLWDTARREQLRW